MIHISTTQKPGLPDSTFAYQKSQFGYILECFEIENVHLVYFVIFGLLCMRLIGIFDSLMVYYICMW
jgi:hypothetical protein